jgi:voltage-gated potassium channel
MSDRPHDIHRRLRRAVLGVAAVTLLGAAGFYIIEGPYTSGPNRWSLLDSIYMAVITVSTVGFTEVHTPSPIGRVFTIVLILFGVGAFTYLATTVANYLITGELQGLWSQRRMQKKIDELSDHYIVCAYGRMGSQVADEFMRERLPVVVIDPRPEAGERAAAAGLLFVPGDAGNDDVLRQAGVARARGLVTCLDNDAGNLMVVLSARTLNEKLFIVSRTNNHETTSKLLAAGANRVLWPYGLGGRRMAQMALRPNVVEFLEIVMHDQELELLLEELTIAIGASLDGLAIGSAAIRGKTGAMLVAVRQRTGRMLVAPPPETVLAAGDIAVALGTRDQLGKLRAMARSAAVLESSSA